jgi:hypothetical protein
MVFDMESDWDLVGVVSRMRARVVGDTVRGISSANRTQEAGRTVWPAVEEEARSVMVPERAES